jgi:hypothetical protein
VACPRPDDAEVFACSIPKRNVVARHARTASALSETVPPGPATFATEAHPPAPRPHQAAWWAIMMLRKRSGVSPVESPYGEGWPPASITTLGHTSSNRRA